MNIEEIMSSPASTCLTEETLSVAARKMWDAGCGVLPVVGEDGRFVGTITDRDICMSAWTRGRLLETIRVEEAMSWQAFALRADQEVGAAGTLMVEKQLRQVPVVDANNKPIGLVSINALARATVNPAGKLEDGLTKVVRTLASIWRLGKRDQAAGSAWRRTAWRASPR